MRDCIYINYHYVQDGSILDLKKKSMGAHPAWFLNDLGILFRYAVRFAGIASLFAVFSPVFLIVLLLTSAIYVMLSFKEQRWDFIYENDSAEDERMMEYLYRTMTDDRYAKEVRINCADRIIIQKYNERYASHLKRKKKRSDRQIFIHTASTGIAVIQSAAMYLYFHTGYIWNRSVWANI